MRRPTLRRAICQHCKLFRATPLVTRNVCTRCYQMEARDHCAQCHSPSHRLSDPDKICPTCLIHRSRETKTCVGCTSLQPIVNQPLSLCRACHQRQLRKLRDHHRQATTIICEICGEQRTPILTTRSVCSRCLRLERNGVHKCLRCKKYKPIHVQKVELCKACYKNQSASRLFRSYVSSYMCKFPQNMTLFSLVVKKAELTSINDAQLQTIKAFGRFLNEIPLPQHVTWESLETHLPALGPTGRNNTLRIRRCLRDVGYLLADQKQLATRESYLQARSEERLLSILSGSPRKLIHSYMTWLREHRESHAGRKRHLEILTRFFGWCQLESLRFPEEVQREHVKAFLLSRLNRWDCTACKTLSISSVVSSQPEPRCPDCHRLLTHRELSAETTRQYASSIKMFFTWAKLHRHVATIPLSGSIRLSQKAIKVYDSSVLPDLSVYIRHPAADPTGAMILFYIIFYLCTSWELRHAHLASPAEVLSDISSESLENTFNGIYIDNKPASRGAHMPGRSRQFLALPDRRHSWLEALRKRFLSSRSGVLKGCHNPYWLVAPNRSRHITPVSSTYIWEKVQTTSREAIGLACTPKLLRSTAAALFSDQIGSPLLRSLGWSSPSAFRYDWAERIIVHHRRY